MLERIQAQSTYAHVTATAALLIAVAGSAMVAGNLIDDSLAANPVNATWFLAGSSNELPACTSCEVSLPASGTASFGSTQNSGNDQLSPNITVIAGDLSVHVDTAPGNRTAGVGGALATRTFLLYSRSDPSHRLQCDISGSNTTCNSGAQTLTILPGSRLLVDAANSGNAPPTKVQLSWRATPK